MNTSSKKIIEMKKQDPMLEQAAKLVVNTQIGSTSLLQRKLKLGYGRACQVMRQLESIGVVGEFDNAAPRKVLIKTVGELKPILDRFENIASS